MPTPLDDAQLSDLDFTDTVVMRAPDANEAADPTERLLGRLEGIVDSIALKIELGSADPRLWRILAALYLGLERVDDYGDLVKKHAAEFGRPLCLEQPAVVFSLPAKINFDDVPKLEVLRSALATPGGAIVDFSAVRRISVGGLIALAELLTALAQLEDIPDLRAIEGFVATIAGVVRSGQGSREMEDLVAAYARLRSSRLQRPEVAAKSAGT